MEYFIFETGGQSFGIDALCVYRVVDDLMITPVPLLPPYYRGLGYHRGELFHVVDGRIFAGERQERPETPHIILLKWNRHNLGLVPERIVGIKRMAKTDPFETEYRVEGLRVKVITPEAIWKRMIRMDYGPGKV
ncbi:MAG: chemotaxis protein CheW [Desulfobacteraceae bacterium]